MPVETPQPAAFLDRDGVLIEDVHLLTDPGQVRLIPGAAGAVARLRSSGLAVVVVTNQPVIARGLVDEAGVRDVHEEIARRLHDEADTAVDSFRVCPHHPSATLERYREACRCRKPRPGLLEDAARELGLALGPASVMVGDRVTDVVAGRAAGCRTVLVRSGRHAEPPIETPDAIDPATRADHECDDLGAAVDWILAEGRAAP